jgi:pterin-4a-carbinolamine dehydratase
MRLIYLEGERANELRRLVGALLVDGGGRWTLSKSGKGLEREVRFKTFKKTWVCGYLSMSVNTLSNDLDLTGIHEYCR